MRHLVVVRTSPDHRDDDGGGGASWAGGEDEHVDDEDQTAGCEDSEDDGEDGVQLLLLLSLVNTHGFRAPVSQKICSVISLYLCSDLFPLSSTLSSSILHSQLTVSQGRFAKLADSQTQRKTTVSGQLVVVTQVCTHTLHLTPHLISKKIYFRDWQGPLSF